MSVYMVSASNASSAHHGSHKDFLDCDLPYILKQQLSPAIQEGQHRHASSHFALCSLALQLRPAVGEPSEARLPHDMIADPRSYLAKKSHLHVQ